MAQKSDEVRKSMDFKTMKGFPSTDLVYDFQEKGVYTYKIENRDFTDHRQFSLSLNPNPVSDSDVAAFQVLQPTQLLEALEKGVLRDPLKEIATRLDEEANPVVLLIKRK